MARVSVDEPLERTDPVWRFTPDDRGRDGGPAKRLAQLVGRDLALVERARFEVPQRRLAARRLVDRARSIRAELREEGVVRRAVKESQDLELGKVPELALGLVRRWDGHRS